MTTDRCAHGELLATWCSRCADDFLARTGPDTLAALLDEMLLRIVNRTIDQQEAIALRDEYAARLAAAGVTVAPQPAEEDAVLVHGEDARGQTCRNCGQPAKAWEPCDPAGVTLAPQPAPDALPSYPSPGESAGFDAEVERLVAAIRTNGGRLHEDTWHVHDDDIPAIAAFLAQPAPDALRAAAQAAVEWWEVNENHLRGDDVFAALRAALGDEP